MFEVAGTVSWIVNGFGRICCNVNKIFVFIAVAVVIVVVAVVDVFVMGTSCWSETFDNDEFPGCCVTVDSLLLFLNLCTQVPAVSGGQIKTCSLS